MHSQRKIHLQSKLGRTYCRCLVPADRLVWPVRSLSGQLTYPQSVSLARQCARCHRSVSEDSPLEIAFSSGFLAGQREASLQHRPLDSAGLDWNTLATFDGIQLRQFVLAGRRFADNGEPDPTGKAIRWVQGNRVAGEA